MSIYRIRNRIDSLTIQESAQLRFAGEPLATSDKGDITNAIGFLLLPPNPCRQVVLSSSTWQVLAVATTIGIMMTAQSEVADGRGRPHIVHRPDHRFTAVDNLSDIL